MHNQVEIPFGTLPLSLILCSNGMVGVARKSNFKAFFDFPEEGLQASFYTEDFVVDGETFCYNVALPLVGKLKEYVVQQKMINPF